MQEPIDSSGELMKDRRYGTGLREQKEPSFGSADYWYAEYVRERKKHMAAVRAVARADESSRQRLGGQVHLYQAYHTLLDIFVELDKELKDETEGSDDN